MTDSRTVFITKQKEEAQELIDSFKDKSKYDILGITWREQNLWTKFLEKRIKNLDKQLKLLELPIKASRTTPAATVKPPFEIGFNKQTITSALTGTWQWTSLSRIREESRPDPRGNGIKDVWEKDVWETIKKTIIVKEGFVRLKTSDNVSNVLDIVRQMKDLIRDARKGDYTLKKGEGEYTELMKTAKKKIEEEMDRQLTPKAKVGNSVFSYRVSSLLLVPGVYSNPLSDDMVLDVYPAILLRPDKLKKEILDIKKGFKISVVENTTTAPPSTTAPTTPVTPIQAPAAPEADQAANQATMARIQQEQRERLLKEKQDKEALLLKEKQDQEAERLLKEKQDQEALQDAKDLQQSTEKEIARITQQNEEKRKKDQKLLKEKLEAERLLKENEDKAQAALDLKAQQPKEEVKEEEAQQPKEEEAQEVQEEKEEEKKIEINKAKMKEAQEAQEETPPAPSTKPAKPLPAPPDTITTPSTNKGGETKNSTPPELIAYNTEMSKEIYTVMRTSLKDDDFWNQITDDNDNEDEVWDEKKKLIKQLYPLPELKKWKSKTVDDLKANLTTLLNATEKLTYVKATDKIKANKKTKTPEIPATYTFSYVGYVGKKQVLRNLVLPQTNLPKKLKEGKSYILELKYTGETIVGGESKTNVSNYYYPTDNLDFEETNFTTRTVKPIATPIPSGELSAMLAELSSMENTSDSAYSEEKWASDSEDFASDESDFASDEF